MECEERLDFLPFHPVLKPGVVVSIGLEKGTKLSAVFQRYVDFCNESAKKGDVHEGDVLLTDLEFAHCQLLNGNDTAEISALMKNDRIKVRRVRRVEREAEQDTKRMQRESDRNFFTQMRQLMPDLGGGKTADLILDCQGKLADESGRNQQVLSSTVKAHSVLLKRRCRWLREKIRTAVMEVSSHDESNQRQEDVRKIRGQDELRNVVRDVRSSDDYDENEDEDDESAIVSFAPDKKPETEEANIGGAAEIEDEDASYDGSRFRNAQVHLRSNSPALVPAHTTFDDCKKMLRIRLNHSPEAVKLLLEYCYSNRVACLGQEAFVMACKTRPQKHSGPIAPYPISASGSRRWPKSGLPTVTFAVAIAGVLLADEAALPRLSLMCEVAAAQLLTSSNIIEALSLCATHKAETGNDLPRLRKAAMACIFSTGVRGIAELERSQSFKRGLASLRAHAIPTLFQGMLEEVTAHEKVDAKLKDRYDVKQLTFADLDTEDKNDRVRERKMRKLERIENDPDRRHELVDFDMEEIIYEEFQDWDTDAPKQSLKRMAKHLETMSMSSRSMAALEALSSRGYNFTGRSDTINHSSSRRTRRKSKDQHGIKYL